MITPYVECRACHYVWARAISPNFCPDCIHPHFHDACDPALDPRRATAYDQIFLADNEWGSGLMQEIALAWFIHNPDCNFVYVHEHAGWSLTFHRGGQCVHSANDRAGFPADRPLPTHCSTISQRRLVRSEDREVTTLSQYGLLPLLLAESRAALARDRVFQEELATEIFLQSK